MVSQLPFLALVCGSLCLVDVVLYCCFMQYYLLSSLKLVVVFLVALSAVGSLVDVEGSLSSNCYANCVQCSGLMDVGHLCWDSKILFVVYRMGYFILCWNSWVWLDVVQVLFCLRA
ncbi:hypothetical protein D5086_027126 [Populus alba]|uniref:Uncharacterized protein n=1 Tax=Populus alba TaxID=43335 RepID=A0ACC4B3U8_POPAL